MSNFDFIFGVHVGDVLGVSWGCFEFSDACLRETGFVCGSHVYHLLVPVREFVPLRSLLAALLCFASCWT